jgi:hypothetical protein
MIEAKPVPTSPSTQAPISSEKTEVKVGEQKGAPSIERIESAASAAHKGIHQTPASPIQPPPSSQEVQATRTVDKTEAAVSETTAVTEKQDPLVPPSPVQLTSAPAVPTPSKPAPDQPPPLAPTSKPKEPPKTPTAAKSEGPAVTTPTKTQPSPVQDAPKKTTEAKSSGGQKEASVPSTQSKPEEPSKSVPAKPSVPESPPTTPDVPSSDQAPVPPKRRGHKGTGTSAPDQGGASKPATQPPQSKGPKQGPKGKK